MICTWLPPAPEPRPSWGELPIRTPPARPTLSRRGVTTQPAARFRPRRAGLGLLGLRERTPWLLNALLPAALWPVVSALRYT